MSKLYTEEQLYNTVTAISNYLDDMDLSRAQDRIEKHLKAIAPIELPSDDEINNASSTYANFPIVEMGFYEGAKWLKQQILNQNK